MMSKTSQDNCHHHDYDGSEQEESQNEEEPEEPLGIMPKVTAIIFLIAIHGFLAFFDQHGIDLSNMLPHFALLLLFVLLVENFLIFLPVGISNPN
ncbi:MAG: hypothetical protein KBF13_02645 [Prevotella sp.]|nr:hypothetical protein [Prevotella sp.]